MVGEILLSVKGDDSVSVSFIESECFINDLGQFQIDMTDSGEVIHSFKWNLASLSALLPDDRHVLYQSYVNGTPGDKRVFCIEAEHFYYLVEQHTLQGVAA